MTALAKRTYVDYYALRHLIGSKTRLFVDREGKNPRELKVGIDAETGPMYLASGHVWCYFAKDKVNSYAEVEGQMVFSWKTEEGGSKCEEIEEAIVAEKKKKESKMQAFADGYRKIMQEVARFDFAKMHGEKYGSEEAAGRRFDVLLLQRKRKKTEDAKEDKGKKKPRK